MFIFALFLFVFDVVTPTDTGQEVVTVREFTFQRELVKEASLGAAVEPPPQARVAFYFMLYTLSSPRLRRGWQPP